MAPQGYWQVKCAGCGHSRARHTHRPNPGCTVDVYKRRTLGTGRKVATRKPCACTHFREPDPVIAKIRGQVSA